jgi:hypothetical protein
MRRVRTRSTKSQTSETQGVEEVAVPLEDSTPSRQRCWQ